MIPPASPHPLSRPRMFWHLVLWELRRLLPVLAGWLVAGLTTAVLVHLADWSWPENRDEDLRQLRIQKQVPVDWGMSLAAAMGVYLTGALFIPLRPGPGRARLAYPPRREDALWAALLIYGALVFLPYLYYYHGWVEVQTWELEPGEFGRRLFPPVLFGAAALVAVAVLAGEWTVYLLGSGGLALAVLWWLSLDGKTWQHLPPVSTPLLAALSVAAAFMAARGHHRGIILGVWVPGLLLLSRW